MAYTYYGPMGCISLYLPIQLLIRTILFSVDIHIIRIYIGSHPFELLIYTVIN